MLTFDFKWHLSSVHTKHTVNVPKANNYSEHVCWPGRGVW